MFALYGLCVPESESEMIQCFGLEASDRFQGSGIMAPKAAATPVKRPLPSRPKSNSGKKVPGTRVLGLVLGN